jgi:hypothetical protein
MKNPTCPYCKKELTFSYPENELHFVCKNHIGVDVVIPTDPYKHYWLSIEFSPYSSRHEIYIQSNKMYIVVLNGHIVHYPIPFDPNLTPENFESKLKLYLTFQ